MELLVVDLTGPMSVPTWTGRTYTLIVVEASHHKGVGRLLNGKDEAAPKLCSIIVLLERQANHKTQTIRSDNGPNHPMAALYCNTYYKSVPHVVQYNAPVHRV